MVVNPKTGKPYGIGELQDNDAPFMLPAKRGRVAGDATEPIELPPAMQSHSLAEFLKLRIPPRKMLLAPIVSEKSLSMMYGPRGCGKTHLAVGIALAVASGSPFLRWDAPSPRKVLYVDGEMPGAALQDRLKAAAHMLPNRSYADDHFRMLSSDVQPQGLPDLSTDAGQAAFESQIQDADFLVLDNISTLCRSGKENEAESWGKLQEWLLRQRRNGRSVLLLHHSGKTGDQRGTSRREDVLDTVIKLSLPSDYVASEGLRTVLDFTKTRGFFGNDAESFEAALKDGEWIERAAISERDQRIVELAAEGKSHRDIGKAVKTSAATVTRVLKRHNAKPRSPANED